ncbi:MAG: Ldh family oxidoreductase [Pseudomonadota bacterium]
MTDNDRRYDFEAVFEASAALLAKAGLSEARARNAAQTLIEADLMGFTTHGLKRLPDNVTWLTSGEAKATGDPIVLSDAPVVFNWDGDGLSGIWLLRDAVREAAKRAKSFGTAAGVVSRCQHIAALAAYLPYLAEQGLAGTITACTPSEPVVCGPDTATPVVSNNPIAFVAPASDGPFLFDVSMATTSIGAIDKARQKGEPMAFECLRRQDDGVVTDDPNAFYDTPPAAILPVGGASHGYKGFCMSLMAEVLSSGLSNYGRADLSDGEMNAAFIQVFDPEAFGARAAFEQEIDSLKQTLRAGGVERIPGERAWRLRTDQMQNGLRLADYIVDAIKPVANAHSVPFPEGR